jgi:hypothetical protein
LLGGALMPMGEPRADGIVSRVRLLSWLECDGMTKCDAIQCDGCAVVWLVGSRLGTRKKCQLQTSRRQFLGTRKATGVGDANTKLAMR